jgi:hypothetical protein
MEPGTQPMMPMEKGGQSVLSSGERDGNVDEMQAAWSVGRRHLKRREYERA